MANGEERYHGETGLPEENTINKKTGTVWRPMYGWAPRESFEKHTSKAHIRSQRRDEEDARANNRIYTDDQIVGKADFEKGDLFDLGNNIFDLASSRGEKYAQKSACSLCGGAIQSGMFDTDFIMQQELCQKCDTSGIGLMPF